MYRHRFLLCASVFALLAAACGDADSGSTTTTAAPPPSDTTTTRAAITTTVAAATTTTEAPATTTTSAVVTAGSVCRGDAAPAEPGDVAGASRTDAFGIQQVWVQPGSFVMGTADPDSLEPPTWAIDELASEQPAHEVTISSGFWIDRTEVTNAAYGEFIAAGGYDDPACWSDKGWNWLDRRRNDLPRSCTTDEPTHPRACITWYEAEAYAAWRGVRLPTEAEWEYAARGPESLIYPWGDEWNPALAQVVDAVGTAPVGSYPDGASWVGALDMSGNVMEWVSDWLGTEYYAVSPAVDPRGPDEGSIKVEKGGWWGNVPYVARAAYRHFEDPPSYQDHHIGFRVVSPTG